MNEVLAPDGLSPGFTNPVFESQHTFRRVLDAMSRPGLLINLDADLSAPADGIDAAAAIALALLDFETPIYLSPVPEWAGLAQWLRFHCGCPIVENPGDAAFALVRVDAMPALDQFNSGDPKYPDRSATLIIVCPSLEGGDSLRLAGPGIADFRVIAPTGFDPAFWDDVRQDRSKFQLGIDLILTSDNHIVALPRSTRIALED
ncbi:MAG: phosphonate C-P lyase system protein PhnH [Alphaproteobacteria bacterium]|nr:phosphonate C-P lyase system protein PhnH [Alphaproteobacteria bacterium]